MSLKARLTKILSVVGAVLVWIPILAPVLFMGLALISGMGLHFDYLMPAELFPLALIGGGLLLWVAIWAHCQVRLIGWSYGMAIGLLVGGQTLAVATGLASGEIEPSGVWWALVIASLVFFVAALVSLGVGGILLVNRLFRPVATA